MPCASRIGPRNTRFRECFGSWVAQMLANMSVIDPHSAVNWSDLGVSGLLLTETVTLLLADVEVSTRLWQTQPEMTGAAARLEQTVSEVVAAHRGVRRPIRQVVAGFVTIRHRPGRAPIAPINRCLGRTGLTKRLLCKPLSHRVVNVTGIDQSS